MDVEVTQVAAGTVTALAPFLPILLEAAKFSAAATGEMIVQKGGEAAWKKAKAAWAKIKGQYSDDGVVLAAATMVAAQPEDENLQQILAIELAKRLNESPKLTKELLDLLGGEKSVQKVLADRSSWVENVTQRMTGGGKQVVSATDDSIITGVQQIKG